MMQTGDAYLGMEMPGWTLHTGTEDRSFRTPDIAFDPPFQTPPKVVLAIKGFDGEIPTKLGIEISPEDIEPEEFNIRIKTWGDLVLYHVTITWIAFDG